jgi:hypothetical protein
MSKRKFTTAEETNAPDAGELVTITAEAPKANAATQERQPGDEPAEKPKRQFKPVFGFTSRFTGPLKYRKFTDANLKIIGFKFNLADQEKLSPEALEVMRENKVDADGNATGLKFRETRLHGKIWQIPNDEEGRVLADRIDFKLSQIAEKLQEAQGKTLPF